MILSKKALLLFPLLLIFILSGSLPAQGAKKNVEFKAMTRNVYLGADLSPGLEAANLAALSQGAGEIYRSVGATRPGLRMKAIAREIRNHNPDLVGLQEVALWREITPPNVYLPSGDPPIASKVRFDFLDLILKNLNRGQAKKKRYRVIALTKEFDFEAPADIDSDLATCHPGNWSGALGTSNGCSNFPGADLTGRLTMRDVVLAKRGTEVLTTIQKNFSQDSLYGAQLAGGINVPVTRGWTAADVRIRKAAAIRFVNTHLEAFSDPEGPRCAQARELYDQAIKDSPYPVVLAGDLNSDDNTVDGDTTTPGLDGGGAERCAYLALIDKGLRSVTQSKATCCLTSSLLASPAPGEFRSQIDHILSNSKKIRRLGPTRVVGRKPLGLASPYLASDHLGLVQKLQIRGK